MHYHKVSQHDMVDIELDINLIKKNPHAIFFYRKTWGIYRYNFTIIFSIFYLDLRLLVNMPDWLVNKPGLTGYMRVMSDYSSD